MMVVTANPFEGSDAEALQIVDNGRSTAVDPTSTARRLLLSHPRNELSPTTADCLSFTELDS